MIGRFIGSAVVRFISPAKVLIDHAVAVILLIGTTIVAIRILCMAIVGCAIVPVIQGVLAGIVGLQFAFIVLLVLCIC